METYAAEISPINSQPYKQCLINAKKINWDIDSDVIRFRTLNANDKYLPDSLSLVV